jgi:leucyl-tRNA synthetase
MGKYNPRQIEKKWQREWEKTQIYKTPDRVRGKENFYHLVMFPYPSGDLHIGHWYNFGPADVYARLKRMQGFNVLSPIGFDSFGLPAENAAIKKGIHPREWTQKNIEKMRKQLKSIGTIYDWSREITTSEPEYYKWTQWMFLQLYKANLAYRAKVPANFCLSCKTVLANEQVVDGRCERCGSEVVQKEIEQWVFKISDFAEDLLRDLDNLDWPETTKIMQRNWIGRSEGWEIKFKVQSSKFKIPVFTTRADTLFGCTYLVVAPEHPIIKNLKFKIKNLKFVEQYIEESKKKTERERISEMREKTGIELRGIKAVNPVNGREIPIFVADYVLIHYGTGAIMAVPAHDQRDFDFAKKHNLPIIEVISGGDLNKGAYEGEGTLVNSDRFTGIRSTDAKERVGEWLARKGLAEKKVYYRLRDWLISRQRYWGAPIPMVFCQKCGWQPVKEKDLPILLPKLRDYKPTGEGRSPLAKSKKFFETACPKCGGSARRETDTMDTFVCSSWYYLRYADPRNEGKFAAKEKIRKWLPVNMYIGGAEHTVLHLLYSRFFTKVLKKLGHLDFKEPFLTLRHQGIILGQDLQKMSKSRGNVVDPDEQVKKYGSDAIRMYLCFMGPYSQGGSWSPNGIVGIYRFLNRIWDLCKNSKSQAPNTKQTPNPKSQKLLHKTIKKVTEDIENFRFNTAISALMILVNEMQKQDENTFRPMRTLLLLLAPFAPHLAEELWLKIGEKDSIHNQKWPEYDPKLIEEAKIQLIIQINGRVRDKVEVPINISQEEAEEIVLKREKVKKWIEGKEVKKIIFVPGKLINLVV